MACGRANQQLVITNTKNIAYDTGLVKHFLWFISVPCKKSAAALLHCDIICNLYSTGLDKTIRILYT